MSVLPITYDAQLFIDGEFADAASGKTMDIVNPATGVVIGRLADACASDVDRAATAAQRAFDQGEGVLRLAPTWVPRSFCVPGRRIKLDPGDYFALGGARGGIEVAVRFPMGADRSKETSKCFKS